MDERVWCGTDTSERNLYWRVKLNTSKPIFDKAGIQISSISLIEKRRGGGIGRIKLNSVLSFHLSEYVDTPVRSKAS